jgi:antitoxin (DNA-binding transcriptional repressor) of toxin-antitoxin stability system
VKTVSKHEAAKSFEALGDLVHSGETVLVVDAGKPWVKLVPAAAAKRGKSAADFRARLDRISRKPIRGVADVLQRLRR